MLTLPTDTDVQSLAARVRGPVYTAADGEFAAEVAPFNASAHHTPEVVVGAMDAHDVSQAVLWARDFQLPVSVQATGHGAVGSIERGVLISTRRMQDLHLDPSSRTVRVGAGVKWRAVIDAAAPFGLAPLSGSSSDVGAVGYTLGGGLPILGRTFGFASDFVRGFDVVTADGQPRAVSEREEPELFWALRGGKPNVGIVTTMTIELVPVSRLYGGSIFFDGVHADRLLHAYGDWTASLPDRMTTALKLMRLPPLPEVPLPLQGKLTVQLVVAHVGDESEGERLVKPMRDIAPALMDDVSDMPYSAADSIHRDPEHPIPVHETCMLLSDLTPAAVSDLLTFTGPEATCPLLMVEIRHLGGQLGKQPVNGDAVAPRDSRYCLMLLGVLMPPVAEAVPGALTATAIGMAPHSSGHTMVNLHGTPTTDADRARPWSAETYTRLLAIKRSYDPDDVFRFGHALVVPGI